MLQEIEKHPSPCDVIIVLHKNGKFLLSNRTEESGSLNGQCVFPSEKREGLETPEETFRRGILEEMGPGVVVKTHNILPLTMAHTLSGNPRPFKVILSTDWEGEIVNKEKGKEAFEWVERDEVMDTLTVVQSKLIFLMVLLEMKDLRVEDFQKAPALQIYG